MTDRQSFLDAIIENPEDDTVRLVYADWLDENGDEADRDRARLIRLQIELETVEDHDRRGAIIRECESLIERHLEPWSHGFVTSRFSAGHCRTAFKRGFLSSVMIGAEDLPNPALDALVAHEPVTDFDLDHSVGLEAYADWNHLHRAHRVIVSGGYAAMPPLLRSPLLTGLREVRMSGRPFLGEEGVALIASSPRFSGLRRLDISHSDYIRDRAVELIAESRTLTNLTAFDYGATSTTIAALETLADSPLAGKLTYLGLAQDASNRVPCLGSRAAELLCHFRRLEGINLLRQMIGYQGAKILAACPNMAGLKSLNLARNDLGARGVAALLSSPHLTGIEELDLSRNRQAHKWVASLADAGPRRLRRLHLGFNEIGGEAAARLANSVVCGGLREWELCGCPIGNEGAIAIANSTRLTGLRRLDLRWCEIDDDGARAIADSPTLGRLRGTPLSRRTGSDGLFMMENDLSDEVRASLEERFGYDPTRW